MRKFPQWIVLALACLLSASAWAGDAPAKDNKKPEAGEDPATKPQQVATEGSVSIEGRKQAIA